MRDALTIFDQMVSFTGGNLTYEKVCASLNVLSTEYYFKLVDYFLSQDVPSCMLLFNEVLNKGFEGGNFIAGLASHMRQLLVAKDTATLPLLEVSAKTRERYCEQAKKCDTKFIYRAIKLCNECDQAYRQSHNKRLQVEICLIQCAQITAGDDTSGSGRCPEKILKPIFSLAMQAQLATPQKVVQVQAPIQQTAHEEKKDIAKVNIPTSTPTVPVFQKKIKLGQLGPSIKGAATQQASQNSIQEAQTLPKEDKPFTQENLTLEWHKYVERLPLERRAMAMRMKNMMPKLINETTFEIVANNEQIAQYLQNMKEGILKSLRQNIMNSQIQMLIRIAEVHEVQHITSKPALYKKMAEQNKNLQKLTELLKLEIC
jgi:DNA polymerase-3 subunit gamma/tau